MLLLLVDGKEVVFGVVSISEARLFRVVGVTADSNNVPILDCTGIILPLPLRPKCS